MTAVVVLPPGAGYPYRPADWVDAIVEVDDGQLELLSCTGACMRFSAGDLLVLEGLALRALRSIGPSAAVLVTITRSGR